MEGVVGVARHVHPRALGAHTGKHHHEERAGDVRRFVDVADPDGHALDGLDAAFVLRADHQPFLSKES